MEALTGALGGILAAIGLSTLLFVGANRLFDLIVDRWRLYMGVLGLLAGGSFFAILAGNRVLDGSSLRWVGIGALLFAGMAVLPDLVSDRRLRFVVYE